jgi:hypothetical protein
MLVQIQGVIRGKQIELEHETGLPAGSVVIVEIQPKPLSLEEKRQLVDSLCGVWASDSSLPPTFKEIEQQRILTIPREINFDATS